jgi:hypothetical protein
MNDRIFSSQNRERTIREETSGEELVRERIV